MEIITKHQACFIYGVLAVLMAVAGILEKYSATDNIWLALLVVFGNCLSVGIVFTREKYSYAITTGLGAVGFVVNFAGIFVCVIALPNSYVAGIILIGNLDLSLGLILFGLVYNGIVVEHKSMLSRRVIVRASKTSLEEMSIPIRVPSHVVIAVHKITQANDSGSSPQKEVGEA